MINYLKQILKQTSKPDSQIHSRSFISNQNFIDNYYKIMKAKISRVFYQKN